MDYPKSKAVALRLVADKFADRAGAVPGSVIPAADWANPVTDEVLAAQAAAGLTATEGQNDQLAEAIRVLARGGALGFRVKPQVGPTLSVDIEAGTFFDRSTGLLVSVAATAVGPIVAPAGNPRKDIVYIDAVTGAPGIQAGIENAAPIDPALPAGALPVSRINAYVGMTEIVAADLDELRYLGAAGAGSGAPAFTESFESTEQTITAAGSLTLAHGMNFKPKLVQTFIICKTADVGYAIGDELVVNPNSNQPSTGANSGTSIVPDATNINIRFGQITSVFYVLNKSTGATVAITAANWKLIVRAWV